MAATPHFSDAPTPRTPPDNQPPQYEPDDLLTRDEAAAVIGRSVPRLAQLRQAGEIAFVKNPITREIRFPYRDLVEYVARRDKGILHRDGRRKIIKMDSK